MAQDCAVADKCSGDQPGCGWSPSAAGPSAVVASSSEDPVAKYLCCFPTPHPVPQASPLLTIVRPSFSRRSRNTDSARKPRVHALSFRRRDFSLVSFPFRTSLKQRTKKSNTLVNPERDHNRINFTSSSFVAISKWTQIIRITIRRFFESSILHFDLGEFVRSFFLFFGRKTYAESR